MTGTETGLAGLSDDELRRLEDLVEAALSSGDERGLPVLGYGEISLVLSWPPGGRRFACKRLPPFRSRERLDAYRATLDDYLKALGAAGVRVVETEMRAVELHDGSVAGYVVQPMLPADHLATTTLRPAEPRGGASADRGRRLRRGCGGRPPPRLGRPTRQLDLGWRRAHLLRRLHAADLVARGRLPARPRPARGRLSGDPAVAATPLRRPGNPRHLPRSPQGLPGPGGKPAEGAARGLAPGVPRHASTHTWTSRSPRTRCAATTARTPGSGPPCSGSAGSIAPGAVGSGGGRTPSCCPARSSARTDSSARPSTRACRAVARRASPPPGRTPQAER